MNFPEIKNCPGTLAKGFKTYSKTCLNNVFNGKKVDHILPYDARIGIPESDELFQENLQRISISGVQEKFSFLMVKNKLQLTREGERGTYILKPIPKSGKNPDQMPANEHLTMQIAKQVYGIETAENALIFFRDGSPAYITKRFDIGEGGAKIAQDDFASLAGRTPQTHGSHYKYKGNCLEFFQLLERFVPAYKTEAPKLLRLLIFNYLFANGDAHFKNFSLLETSMGDYRLSPAYDLLNSRIHIEDNDFTLDDGLLPPPMAKGKIHQQFSILSAQAGINQSMFSNLISFMLSNSTAVQRLINDSFLSESIKRNYWQLYQRRLKKLL